MKRLIYSIIFYIVIGCTSNATYENLPIPKEIIDLGALVTEDLPETVWGKEFMKQSGFNESNSFKVIEQELEFPEGNIYVTNSYLTIFNHGGPHIDAPNHVDFKKGIDSYLVDDFIGPLKVIDASHLPLGRTITLEEVMKHDIQSGDIVLIYTNYKFPKEDEVPHRIALTEAAAKYLADLPVKAFGTDALNVESDDNPIEVKSDIPLQRIAPIHYEFLSKGIPLFEQLFHVDKLLDKKNMLFIGHPLNIKNGDGMIVRPVVFVYE